MILAVLQSSLILLIAFTVFHLLRRQSAALRHLILTVALFSATIAPFLGRFVPEHARQSVVLSQVQHRTQQFLKFDAGVTHPSVPAAQTTVPASHRPYASTIWFAGAIVLGAVVLARMLHILLWRRRSLRLVDPRWECILSELCNSLGIRRSVLLLQSERSGLGTLGVLRPCILLPHEAGTWSGDRIRIVLTHELAHIKRFDWFIQIAAELSCAVYWFNPMFWSEIVAAPPVLSTVKPAEPAPKPAMRKAASKPPAAQGRADGSLAGTVSDGSGARIPGVTVTVASRTVAGNSITETEIQTATSDEAGKYYFAALTPGQYSLKAELPGFATYRSVVEVEVSKTATPNIMLSVGSIAQRVTVTGVGQPRPAPLPGVPQRIRVGGNVVAANLISQVKPVYPETARDAGIEGTVHLQGLIGTDGTLLGLMPLNNIRELTGAALDAVRQWQYKPTLLNGEPVQVLTTIDVEFKLAQ